MTQTWDVVIIGGGLAGYVAANYLAKTHLSVLLLESGTTIGGRARTDQIDHNYFNLGPHALYKKGYAAPIFDELGVKLNENVPKVDGVLIENNKEYAAPFNPSGILSSKLLSWKERIEWGKVLMKINQVDPHHLAEQTYEEWVRRIASSHNVQALLYTLGRLVMYCHTPEKVSAKVMLYHMKTGMAGVLYVDGGWQSLMDQLHNQAVISGVHVQTRSAVKRIDLDEGETFKVDVLRGESILANYVLSTAGPHELNDLLSEAITFPNRDGFAETTPIKGATLDVALTQLPRPERLFALSLRAPFYFAVHSQSARLSDNGDNVVLHVFKYHHPDDKIDGKQVKKELEDYLEMIQPGWQAYRITSRCLPQLTVNQRLPQPGEENMFQRSETGLSNLYIAGDWAHPRSILSEGAVSSGKQAAEAIIQKETRRSLAN
ncbi:NAD(P)/FAD-dependent oxidoreductase [Thalassobacillus sp. CUG 92003]|uniref:phytoene desaturase family protein n=1 Tax=Thalassobacillus sp. CUG 92003 TaxID=2736641 RepID=UPI0015E7CD63|nr:NAD(P)/FAD-dependent oxidoreductase [Thalassobacillus sp. CUG 92003]